MKQPSLDIQRELGALADNAPAIVHIPYTKRKVKINWIYKKTVRYITEVLNSKDTSGAYEDKIFCKAMAYIVLNDYWKIRLFYPILWRWYHYVRQYSEYQILPVLECAKKKTPQIPYFLGMAYLNGLRDTLMIMTREEATPTPRESSSDNKA